MDSDAMRVSDESVSEVVATLNELALQSLDARDRILWMVLAAAAESIADALEQRAEWDNDGE